MAAEQRVVELVVDASGAVAGARLASEAYDHMGDRAQAAVKKAQTAFDRQQQVYERQLPRSIDQVGEAYDRLRGRVDPLFNSQLRAEREMTQSLAVINRAVMLGVTTEQEATTTILRLKRQQIEEINRVRDAQLQASNAVHMKPANNNFQTANLAAQGQDIIVSALGGQSATTVGFQQGTQIAQVVQQLGSGREVMQGLAAAATSLISPISLASIGLTAAAAAAIQFGSKLFDSASRAEEVLEKHETTMKRIKELYDKAADSGEQYGRRVQNAVNFEGQQDRRRLELLMKSQTRDLNSQLGIDFSRMGGANTLIGNAPSEAFLKGQAQGKYGPYGDAILKYAMAAKDGRGDVEALNDEIFRIGNDNSTVKKWQEYATTLLAWTAGLTATTDKVKELNKELYKAAAGQRGVLINTPEYRQMLDDVSNADAAERNGIRDLRLGYNAEVSSLGARSPQQRAAAARQAASARTVEGESGALRDVRIELAGTIELARAEQQLKDAQFDRRLNLDKILADQQSEIDLVGKTGGAAAALRKEYELTSQLRLEAARQGIDVDQKELDLIKERAAALGELTDRYNQQRFNFEINQQAADARLPARDLQIIQTQRQYGLPENVNSDTGQRIGHQLDWQEAKDLAKGFGSTFGSELVQSSGDIGKSFAKALQASLEKETQKLWDRVFDGLGNIFADWMTGGAGNSGSGAAAAIGSVAAAFGGKPANDNRAPVIPVTRAALPDVSASTDIASYISKAASERGIDPAIALKVAKSEGGLNSWNLQSSYFKNGVQEPSFGPFQLYKGGGLGNDFMRKTGLDPALAQNGPAGVNFALDHAAKNGWGAWYGAAKVGVGKWDGIGGDASDAVGKLAASAGAATKGLDTFGGGLGKLGQSLSTSMFPAAPAAPSGGGGGGLFGWLGGLFGGSGLNSALSASPQFAKAWSLGGIGLYDRGGFTGHGGVNDPAGVVHRGEVVWSQADVARAGGVGVVEGMRLGLQGYADGGVGGGRPTVAPIRQVAAPAPANTNLRFEHVHSFDGDGNIKTMTRTIVREEAPDISRQVTSDQLRRERKEQERGGFGAVQAAYTKRKG